MEKLVGRKGEELVDEGREGRRRRDKWGGIGIKGELKGEEGETEEEEKGETGVSERGRVESWRDGRMGSLELTRKGGKRGERKG